MSLTGQVEAGVEIKAPASMVHEYFCSKIHHITSACPDKVQSVDLLEGEWGKAGAVIFSRYVNEGKSDLTGKVIMEEIDYENNKISYKLIGGSLLEQYKSFSFFFQVTPKGEGSLVTWTFKYEKPNENVPEPTTMLQFCVDATKDVAAKLIPQV